MFGPSGTVWIATDDAHLSYWQGQSLDAGTDLFVAVPTLGFSRHQLVFDRSTPVGTREDVIVIDLAWCQRAATAVTPLSSADKAVVETAANAFWTSFKSAVGAHLTFREHRWYDYQPITTRPGPVDRVTANGTAGTGGAIRVPDQLAISQTFKTASRKHWGRWYLPCTASATFDLTYGRLSNATTDTLCGYTRTLFQVSGGSGTIHPCVASIAYNGVMGIKELQTDNIVDVIRSRRAKVASYYKRYTS